MRLNKYIALSTGMGRRAADEAISQNRVQVNGHVSELGLQVGDADKVTLDGIAIRPSSTTVTIMLNKPAGYVCSREGQGSRTVYDLLPVELHSLKTVGRLDKDSSGLLLLTDDGQLAHRLTHPGFAKTKVYQVHLDTPLRPLHRQMISDHGIKLEDGPSRMQLERLREGDDTRWQIRMHEGRNRQIRRTFAALGYKVIKLHRTNFGQYELSGVPSGKFKKV